MCWLAWLFSLIGQLWSARTTDWPSKWRSTSHRHAQQTALQILGFIVQRLHVAYFNNTITVSTHLQCVAEIMMMTFFVYRAELLQGRKNTFIPAVLFEV